MYLLNDYDSALETILRTGVRKENKRTGTKTMACFGLQTRYRLDTGYFPIVTRRKVYPKSIFAELLWFISGSTNNNDLLELGSSIWTPWVGKEFEKKHGYAPGSFGPTYGFQLRYYDGLYCDGDSKHRDFGYGGFDQLAFIIDRIKEDPSCRRILFDLWNPLDTPRMRLPPCHYSYQVFIDDDGNLSGMVTQRSCDFPIGIPANIQFYSALTIMIAQQTGYKPFELIHSAADAHIYCDQIPAVNEYLASPLIASPKLEITKAQNIFSYSMDDFILTEYIPGPSIKIPLAV